MLVDFRHFWHEFSRCIPVRRTFLSASHLLLPPAPVRRTFWSASHLLRPAPRRCNPRRKVGCTQRTFPRATRPGASHFLECVAPSSARAQKVQPTAESGMHPAHLPPRHPPRCVALSGVRRTFFGPHPEGATHCGKWDAPLPLCEMTDSRPRFLTKTPIAAPRPDRVLFCPLSGRAAGAIEPY